MRTRLGTLEKVGLALVTVCGALGLYLWIARPLWPAYFPALDVHVWSGVALTVLSAPLLVGHLRRYRSSGKTLRIASMLLAPASVSLFLVRDDTPFEGYLMFALSLIGLATAALLAWMGFTQPPSHQREARPRGGRHGSVLTIVTAATLSTGILALLLRSDEAQVPRQYHSAIGLVAVFLLVAHMPFKVLPVKTPAWLLALLCGVSLAFWSWQYDHEHTVEIYREGVVARWETTTSPADLEAFHGEWTTFDLDAEAGSASCATAGCHEALHEQWRGSAHRFSADNDFYRKVVALFVEEQGAEAAGFCASCHDPVRVFNGTVAEAYADGAPPPGEGVSCIGCHVAFDAPEPFANGVVEYRKDRPYPGEGDRQAHNIATDPRFHMRNFLVENFHIHGPSCIPCHRLSLDGLGSHGGLREAGLVIQSVVKEDYAGADYAPTAPGEDDPDPEGMNQIDREYYGYTGCIECHLVIPRTLQENVQAEHGYAGGYGIYPHHMVGLNSDLALYASHPDRDEAAIKVVSDRVEAFLGGDVQPECRQPTLREREPGPSLARDEGVVTLEVVTAQVRDGTLHLATNTWNDKAAHPFPIGPFDLFEVWQEVQVVDASGRVVHHQGFLDADKRVDPAAHRLGARELNADGEEIEKHRIWTVTQIADKRVIHSGTSVPDTHAIPLPEEVAWPLTVDVGWRFRRANQDFVDWVYDGDGRTMPIRELARVSVEVGR